MASAIGGTVLAAQTIVLGGHELPSLAGYRGLFAICAAAAFVGAGITLVIPTSAERTATGRPAASRTTGG